MRITFLFDLLIHKFIYDTVCILFVDVKYIFNVFKIGL